MDDEIKKLKKEINSLKEKLKKKGEKLKKQNKKIIDLLSRRESINSWNHCIEIEHGILKRMTSHIDRFFYEIEYKYEGKIYSEFKVKSYGSNWLEDCLCFHLARKKNYIIHPYEIEIIKAKKLW